MVYKNKDKDKYLEVDIFVENKSYTSLLKIKATLKLY